MTLSTLGLLFSLLAVISAANSYYRVRRLIKHSAERDALLVQAAHMATRWREEYLKLAEEFAQQGFKRGE